MTSRKLSLPLISVCLIVVVSFAVAGPVFSENRADERVAAASCQRCGDGYCARSCENERTCPADCAPQTFAVARCGKCGDGRCVPQCGETAQSCPADCGATEASVASQEVATTPCEPAESEPAAAPADPKKE